MKFNPTVNQLVLIVILFIAIIGSNIWAPGVVGIVTSLASVLVGFGAGTLQGGLPASKEGSDGGTE